MWDFEEIKREYQKHVSKELFEHNLRVAELSKRMAKKFGADPEKAKIAGLVHDLAYPRTAELLNLARNYGIEYSSIEENAPILLHGPVGATMLPEVLGIDDKEIKLAVWWHTTCREGATTLEKIVFLADKIEFGMNWEGVEEVRKAAQEDLNKACLKYFDLAIPQQIKQGFALHPALIAARNEMILRK